MIYYINLFFIFSIFGYFIESTWNFLCRKKFGSGILYLPWTPIYGFGSVLIILVFNFIQKFIHVAGWLNSIILAVIMMVVLTLIELLGGMFIERIFHKTFWDYTPFKFNIGKYISLEISLIWAFSSVILAYIVEPLAHPFIKGIPIYITIMFIILFAIDNIFTYISGKTHE